MADIGTENLVSLNTLVFGSLEFLFWYLPVFVLLFYLAPARWRAAVLFLGSIVLYGLGEPVYCFVLLGMTVVNYLFGLSLGHRKDLPEQDGKYRAILWSAILCNVGLLIYFKVSSAFDSSFLMPLGISFYVFKSISYLVDVYRGKILAERSWVRVGAYLSLFFQVVSGPIARYEVVERGFLGKKWNAVRLEAGLIKVIAGLAAKILIADRLGILWNDVQTIGFESISTPLAWLGMYAYSLQLYFDFAGYSLMAVGIGQMLGFPGVRNFDFPYASRSVGEFFRRWHMTLGSWFKDYVYIPAGGNRQGTGKMIRNLFLVWLLTGFWHGRSLNFLVWGIVLGILVVLEKVCFHAFLEKHKLLSHMYVLLAIPVTWMIFAIPELGEAGVYLLRLFPVAGQGVSVNRQDFYKEVTQFWPVLAAGCLLCVPKVTRWLERRRNSWWMKCALFLIFWFCVYRISVAVGNPFMYANF